MIFRQCLQLGIFTFKRYKKKIKAVFLYFLKYCVHINFSFLNQLSYTLAYTFQRFKKTKSYHLKRRE